MDKTALSDIYRNYIACLNAQDWPRLGQFVADDARHNGRPFGLSGYRKMLERDFEEIPTSVSMSRFWSAIRPSRRAGSISTARRAENSSASR